MSENRNTEDPPEETTSLPQIGSFFGATPPPDAPAESVDELEKESPLQAIDKAPSEEVEIFYTVDDAVDLAGYKKFQKVLTFLAGMGWLADAFEVIVLSLIGDMMACDWSMKRWQNAVMTSVVFLGMAIGAPIFGMLADKYGRRTILAVSMLLIFLFGAASAASPNYPFMVIARGLMGFSLGGIAQSVTLCCEYYPANMRGRAGFYLSYYWAFGAMGVVGIAWIIMKLTSNWRWFLLAASVPALVVFLLMYWYPESARYYLVTNQPEKAVKMLEWMARMNKAELPKGTLREMDSSTEAGKISDLLQPKLRRQTLLFWYIWLSIACAYYGTVLITPYIVKYKSLLEASKQLGNTSEDSLSSRMPCIHYTDEQFLDMLWNTAAEIPGLFVFTLTIEMCDRTVYLGSTTPLLVFLMLFLMLKIEPEIALLLILFVCRALVAAIFQLLFIMTTEAFPTVLRATAMGTGSSCARIGGLLIPYLAQLTVITHPIPSMICLSVVTALGGVAAFLLPLETRGRLMRDVVSVSVIDIQKPIAQETA